MKSCSSEPTANVVIFVSTTRRKEDTKRQRTGSDSSSLPSDSKTLLPNADSDEEGDQSTKAPTGSHKKMRGAAARNHRDKEIRDREEKRERERADAAGRRKGRAERRRGDGISPSLPCWLQVLNRPLVRLRPLGRTPLSYDFLERRRPSSPIHNLPCTTPRRSSTSQTFAP